MKKEILKQLKSDYEKLEIKPSADLWDRIEQSGEDPVVLSPKKPFQWLKYAAVLLLLLSVGALLYLNEDVKKKSNIQVVSSEPVLESSPAEKEGYSSQHLQPVQDQNTAAVSSPENGKKSQPDKIDRSIPVDHFNTQNIVFNKEEKPIISPDQDNAGIVEKEIHQNIEKNLAAENKKTDYINADELLLGREFDKTRQEGRSENKKFGVLDMNRIKFRSPNSLKIFGVTVYSDSLETR